MKKYEITIFDAIRGILSYEDDSLEMVNFIFSEKLKDTKFIKDMVITEYYVFGARRVVKSFENIKWRTHIYEH